MVADYFWAQNKISPYQPHHERALGYVVVYDNEEADAEAKKAAHNAKATLVCSGNLYPKKVPGSIESYPSALLCSLAIIANLSPNHDHVSILIQL